MDKDLEAAITGNRFGLGAVPGSKNGATTKAALLAEITIPWSPDGVMPPTASLVKQGRAGMAAAKGKTGDEKQVMRKAQRQARREVLVRELDYRTKLALAPAGSFRERLVWFWSNHFTVSAQGKPLVEMIVGAFEREAIRANLHGSFSDLLLAVTRHPAMQLYLDNAVSVGPNSTIGKRRQKGLNENLAREILELHTLGVGSGYTQEDVIALASMLTGWGISREGAFQFRKAAHEPGAQTLLGATYAASDERQAEAALQDIAKRPETAKFIATKLALAMHSDDPPKSLIDRLETTFITSGGSLPALHMALIEAPEMWHPNPVKFKTPQEFIISMMRMTGTELPPRRGMLKVLKSLNHMPFYAPSPAGWSSVGKDWASPSAIKQRLIISTNFAKGGARQIDPAALAELAIGPFLSADTRFILNGASSAEQGLVLLLMCPEFQRR
ncbi:MAG: DUF1800 domain-containing protein [Parvularculaceae bacterium]